GGSFSDAKDMDAQAGVETTMMLNATLECNPVYVMHGLGSLGTLNVVSLEKFILDEEVINCLKRQQRGIDCSDKKLCFKEIQETGPRGSFLTGKTPKIYREEFYMTRLFNKDDPNNWQNSGGKTVKETAGALVEKRLESYTAPERTKDQLKLIKEYIPEAYWELI
ncbi:MAG: trimethylamine methyltransferase family protein, partial [Eubacterium sp.]